MLKDISDTIAYFVARNQCRSSISLTRLGVMKFVSKHVE